LRLPHFQRLKRGVLLVQRDADGVAEVQGGLLRPRGYQRSGVHDSQVLVLQPRALVTEQQRHLAALANRPRV
jgi:hypothetical protein